MHFELRAMISNRPIMPTKAINNTAVKFTDLEHSILIYKVTNKNLSYFQRFHAADIIVINILTI